MKICAISDTHNLHNLMGGAKPWSMLPDADVLVHCGDMTSRGTKEEFDRFINWFGKQEHKHKIFVAGNHDRYLEHNTPDLPDDIIYLHDESVTIDGVKFFGSPAHKKIGDFPFGIEDGRGQFDAKFCDILITHGPPFGICDDEPMKREHHLGSKDILYQVKQIDPDIHLFGHVHYAETRMCLTQTTNFINCSIHPWLWKGEPVQLPVVFDYDK